MLVYTAITSLDGYVVDADGSFAWAAPDEQVHQFVNDLERGTGTYLYGRRMYEVMRAWQDMPTEGEPPAIGDFAAMWRAAEKVVHSRTLTEVSTPRTRIARDLDAGRVRRLVDVAPGDVSIGGPTLAGAALAEGLVDEVRLFLTPVVVGGGTASLPDGVRVALELLDHHRFDGGVIYLRYRVRDRPTLQEDS